MSPTHIFLCLVPVLICFVIQVQGCGIITHMVIGSRTTKSFNGKGASVDYERLIQDNRDAFQAGSAYPDSFYSNLCNNGNYSNVSEDTHWIPFIKTAVDYIRNKYPQPWNQATQKLVVFLFGIMSHQVSDVLWHSLDIEHGFIPTLAAVDFHGNYSLAHEAADLGGDVVSVWRLHGVNDIDPVDDWYVPTEDLFNIYQEYYGKVVIDKDTIDSCSTLLVLASIAELYGMPELYQVVAETSPFLENNMIDYFLGGVDDMVGWSDRGWKNLITLLEKGTSACDLPHNPVFVHCNQSRTSQNGRNSKARNGFFVQRDLRGLTVKDVNVIKHHRGISIQPKSHIKKDVQRILNRQYKERQHVGYESKSGVYAVNSSYAKLGWALTTGDMDSDGYVDIIMGSPGYSVSGSVQEGRVYIVYGNDSDSGGFDYYSINLDVKNEKYNFNPLLNHMVVIPGFPNKQSRFGSGVAVLDINLDGVVDLVVGAPAYWIDNPLEYKGLISIYLGKSKGSRKYDEVDITITCQSQYCNIGFNIEAGDINGDGHEDLVMGLPFYSGKYNQSGVVAALMASKDIGAKKNVAFEDIKWRQTSDQEQPFAWFGFHMMVKNQTLKVSSPNTRKCMNPSCKFSPYDIQEIGRADILNYGKTAVLKNQTIFGTKPHESAGFSIDFGYLYDTSSIILAVGYPGMTVQGSYWTLPINITRAGSVILYNVTGASSVEVARFEGNSRYGGFGSLVMVADVNGDGVDDLLIGEPSRNGEKAEIVNDDDGIVYVYYGGSNFPRGNPTIQNCGLTKPCPQRIANFVSKKYEYEGVNNGYKARILNTGTEQVLFTSDIRYSFSEDVLYAGELTGGVHHYFVNRKN